MPNSPSALRLSTVARLGSPGKGENTMDEKNLLDLWNTKRSQIIKAQMAPNLMLIGIFVLAAFGKFDGATDGAKYLAIGVAATTGILSMITQYATIREAERSSLISRE